MGDAFSFLKNSTLSRSELNYESGKFKYIHYGDILTKFGDITDTRNFSVPFVTTPEKVIRLEKYFLQNGDVVIADAAEDSMVGKVTEIQNSAPFPTVSGLHTIPIRPNKEFAAGFLGHYMNAPFYHDQLFKLMQGVKVLSLSKSAVIQTKINFPSYCEQRLISRMINLIDGTITLHEEKKHQLERLKSALLQKMFADKSGYPDIRFEGFSDEWEQCKLGDLADRVTTKNKGMVSELPLTISAQDGLISQDEFFNKKVASKDLSSYLLLHHGDFAYNKSYSNGYPFGTIKRLEKYPQGVVSSLYIAFKPNSSISSDFMAQYYESNNWHKEIYKCAAEGARNHGLLNVPPSDFFATNLNIPITKSEQLKIGRLLNAVDQTITLHDQKLNLLKLVKQSLLQNMFI
ncbi:restriction endonuclease subunit S [Lactobacillus delbrueckii]|uniref:restriction endonuclease subunit S n=1 Tax=Lactobacillus delbrueckii TaxID=1584 RepID=UPI002151A5D0|nr:restriction endonuclease subunit S [Lactobacillus delbrueckii]UUY36541.1 restriction endonuclease subunit S [Lactobacillus delbrueckii subsp. bulgaricus]